MLLWRQTAMGELGAWLGDSLLVLDAHTRRLGFDRLAVYIAFNQQLAEAVRARTRAKRAAPAATAVSYSKRLPVSAAAGTCSCGSMCRSQGTG